MPVSYDDKGKVLKPLTTQQWTEDTVSEYVKCVKSVKYFVLKHCKVPHPTRGLISPDLRDYQMRMLDVIEKHNKVAICTPRQVGKCIFSETEIRIKNKKTGEIREVSISEFFDIV